MPKCILVCICQFSRTKLLSKKCSILYADRPWNIFCEEKSCDIFWQNHDFIFEGFKQTAVKSEKLSAIVSFQNIKHAYFLYYFLTLPFNSRPFFILFKLTKVLSPQRKSIFFSLTAAPQSFQGRSDRDDVNLSCRHKFCFKQLRSKNWQEVPVSFLHSSGTHQLLYLII